MVMTKTEAAKVLARSASRVGATTPEALRSHLSELAYTSETGSLLAEALKAQPALTTIIKNL